MFIQESDRSFALCTPGPGPGQCNIFFIFLCAPVLTWPARAAPLVGSFMSPAAQSHKLC